MVTLLSFLEELFVFLLGDRAVSVRLPVGIVVIYARGKKVNLADQVQLVYIQMPNFTTK